MSSGLEDEGVVVWYSVWGQVRATARDRAAETDRCALQNQMKRSTTHIKPDSSSLPVNWEKTVMVFICIGKRTESGTPMPACAKSKASNIKLLLTYALDPTLCVSVHSHTHSLTLP